MENLSIVPGSGRPYWIDEHNDIAWHRISFSRDSTVAAIHSYYTFLTTLHIPASKLREPPPDGWPTISPSTFAPLNKSAIVIDLLRHLPYLADRYDGFDIAPEATTVDYSAQHIIDDFAHNGGENLRLVTEPRAESMPDYVVGLVYGGQDTPRLLIDTKRGIVYFAEGCPFPGSTPLSVVPPGEDESQKSWREKPAWEVCEFFEMLKNEFRAMRIVPWSSRRVTSEYTVWDEEETVVLETVRGILREHGWPGEGYRKEEAMEAMKNVNEERFPEFGGGWEPEE